MLYILYSNNLNISLEFFEFLFVLTGILTIISNNPIVSVIYLIGLFLSVSIYLIILGINFLGISYLLVYIGAVSILFLFILMLINIRTSELHTGNNNSIFLSLNIGILFYLISNVYYYIEKYYDVVSTFAYKKYILFNTWETYIVDFFDIVSIGSILYTVLALWLILSLLILLLAMVGAIVININNKKE